ncbi:MAG TPA: hypothetical protein VGP94_11540, partial [Tepidisphaeraceae bacterium]|nr:hypothetical protein [Tepidisphaeraceae bacterium]
MDKFCAGLCFFVPARGSRVLQSNTSQKKQIVELLRLSRVGVSGRKWTIVGVESKKWINSTR